MRYTHWQGVGDFDGDGKEEVAFTHFDTDGSPSGSIYIFRGSNLAELTTSEFELESFSAQHGIRIGTIPFYFETIRRPLSLAPDIDSDGLSEFLVTAFNSTNGNYSAESSLLIKSTDITAALNNNEAELDLETLFFNETPEDE